MTVGERIQSLRKQKGMTLEDLSSIIGVSKTTVLKWERGDISSMKLELAIRTAEALGLTLEQLAGYKRKGGDSSVRVTEKNAVTIAGAVDRMTKKERRLLIELMKVLFPAAFSEEETASD